MNSTPSAANTAPSDGIDMSRDPVDMTTGDILDDFITLFELLPNLFNDRCAIAERRDTAAFKLNVKKTVETSTRAATLSREGQKRLSEHIERMEKLEQKMRGWENDPVMKPLIEKKQNEKKEVEDEIKELQAREKEFEYAVGLVASELRQWGGMISDLEAPGAVMMWRCNEGTPDGIMIRVGDRMTSYEI